MTSDPRYKVCPDCRTEYVQTATCCADCGVDLVNGDALSDAEEMAELPQASELACVRVAPLAWIRALSDGLREDGVPHRVEPAGPEAAPEGQHPEVFGDVRLFGLYVQSEHVPSARNADEAIAAVVLPVQAPPLAEGEADPCPACGTPLPPDAAECPDCGLTFG